MQKCSVTWFGISESMHLISSKTDIASKTGSSRISAKSELHDISFKRHLFSIPIYLLSQKERLFSNSRFFNYCHFSISWKLWVLFSVKIVCYDWPYLIWNRLSFLFLCLSAEKRKPVRISILRFRYSSAFRRLCPRSALYCNTVVGHKWAIK